MIRSMDGDMHWGISIKGDGEHNVTRSMDGDMHREINIKGDGERGLYIDTKRDADRAKKQTWRCFWESEENEGNEEVPTGTGW